MTWAAWEDEINRRVHDPKNTILVYGSSKFFFYDPMLYMISMLEEAEHLLRLRNDSLVNWSVGSDNFKNNGQFIVGIFKEAIMNIRVVGLRGTYEFYRNTTVNTGGNSPLVMAQLEIAPNSNILNLRQIAVWDSAKQGEDRLQLNADEIIWQTIDGKPPFDQVQIHTIETDTVSKEATYTLIAISAIISLVAAGLTLLRKQNRSLGNGCLVAGIVIANCHNFVLPMRDVEPIDLHCSILAMLFAIGISCCFFAMWAILQNQYSTYRSKLTQLMTKKKSPKSEVVKNYHQKLLWAITVGLQFFALVFGILFIVSSPIETYGSVATLDVTFGQREVKLPTRTNCQLSTNIFTLVVLGTNMALVTIVVLHSLFLCYEIQLLKKSKKAIKTTNRISTTNTNKEEDWKYDGNYLVILATLIIAVALLLLLLPDQALYITGITAIIFGVVTIVKLILAQ